MCCCGGASAVHVRLKDALKTELGAHLSDMRHRSGCACSVTFCAGATRQLVRLSCAGSTLASPARRAR